MASLVYYNRSISLGAMVVLQLEFFNIYSSVAVLLVLISKGMMIDAFYLPVRKRAVVYNLNYYRSLRTAVIKPSNI